MVYPKVRVRQQREEADQYDYEKTSLNSLKAFDWLSLGADPSSSSSSADESPRSVVRVPWSSISKSPPPSYYASKVDINKEKSEVVEEPKNIRASSAPRPRAVLSSPVNDIKIGSRTQARKDDTRTGSRTQARKELLPGLKNHNSGQNRHAQCKVFPKSTPAGTFEPSQSHNKTLLESKRNLPAKVKTPVSGSSSRAAQQKRVAVVPLRTQN